VIDGEAIIMDLRSGLYYSSDGVGAVIWKAIEEGASHRQILDWAVATFGGEDTVAGDTAAFLLDLLTHGLIRNITDKQSGPAIVAPNGAYRRPILSVHDDMHDMILLDPIHDVDAAGWPTRKGKTA
jgi:hypothetical protein